MIVTQPPAPLPEEATDEGVPGEVYRERCARFARARDALALLGNRVANARLLAFGGAVVLLAAGLWRAAPLLWIPGLLLFGAFLVLVAYHRRIDHRRDRAAHLWEINAEGIARLDRRWEDLPLRHALLPDPAHPYARDLDVFGPGSLLHLLQTVGTPQGDATLADWLLHPAAAAEIRARQGAVSELAPHIELRQELTLQARLLGLPAPDPEPFLRWVVGAPVLTPRPWLLWASRLSPLLMLATLVLSFFGSSWAGLATAPLGLASLGTLGALGVNALLHLRLSATALAATERLTATEQAFRAYADALQLIAEAPFQDPRLRRLQAVLVADGEPAHRHMRRLYRLTGFALPGSHMFYLPVQLLTLWNVHLLAVLERWQAGHGQRARDWLGVLGSVEALASLATLRHDNPEWAFPILDDTASDVDAGDLAHPLLPRAARVANDVRVGPPGTFLLVTGSNMAGKSTFLRAIGANLILAGAGAPVCARALRLPPLSLWTSMHVEDSLQGGVSTFLAEARRLKAIVDAAGRSGPERCLYLVDEPFRGTNAVERQIAGRRVLSHLVRRGAIGAVATHDVDLAAGDGLAPAAQPVHFAETIVGEATSSGTTAGETIAGGAAGPTMIFDYKVRPGLATTTNALRVLDIVGLSP